MKKFGVYCIVFIMYAFLCACATQSQPTGTFQTVSGTPRKNLEYNAVLTDPIIKKDFRNLKAAAIKARVYEKEGHFYFAESDLKQLNALSAILIDRLKNHYHLDPDSRRIHTFIGKNQKDSCYQYYDSNNAAIGKECDSFQHPFKSCKSCPELVALAQKYVQRIVQLHSENATVLIDNFRLKNRDPVYIGLTIS